jgi:hypothetical protein
VKTPAEGMHLLPNCSIGTQNYIQSLEDGLAQMEHKAIYWTDDQDDDMVYLADK